jgi:hypothetical protein
VGAGEVLAGQPFGQCERDGETDYLHVGFGHQFFQLRIPVGTSEAQLDQTCQGEQ